MTQAEQANLPGERGTSTLSLCFERSAVEYPIVVGPGLLHSVGALMCENSSLRGSRKLLVVTDETVEELYAEQLAADLQQLGFEVNRWVVPPGESTKTLEWTQRGCQVAVDCGLDRASTVVALGGGVVGDLAGFVAATFMRGINFVQVPTTLLAQVDASVGGKVAVNLPQGKNLVGAFHQPQLVVIDPEVLLSLPERHYAAGMAEVIKHGVIRDSDYFSFLESHVEGLRRRNADLLTKAIRGSCRIKAAVVQEDEREAGIRAILNFGHTVGHALESVSGYGQLLHGEAVSIGMVVAAELARQQGMLEQEPVQRLGKLLKGFGLPTRIEGAAVDELLEAMKRDKKAQSEKPRWVLPQGLGSASPGHNLPGAAVACALEAAGATACSQE
jgi:3-dehydroquinate synthase